MAKRNLSPAVSALLAGAPEQHFADEAAWLAELHRLGITGLKVHRDPVPGLVKQRCLEMA